MYAGYLQSASGSSPASLGLRRQIDGSHPPKAIGSLLSKPPPKFHFLWSYHRLVCLFVAYYQDHLIDLLFSFNPLSTHASFDN